MPLRPHPLRGTLPFRLPLPPAAQQQQHPHPHQHHQQQPCRPFFPCRTFHASRCLFLDDDAVKKSHYERLNVRHDASPTDIKKSFYSLSKAHHPDANPSNPKASEIFSLLSESYHALSDPSRRATYDRQVLGTHHSHHAGHPKGSYHSTNPAGGRAPSGLSRRRGTFRGPPPSFYRSGGWGNQSEKRRKAHAESTGGGGDGASSSHHAGEHSAFRHQSAHGGMGPGSDPYGHQEEVPHFDKPSHARTHAREDKRRWQRQRRAVGDDDIEFEPQTSIAGHFMIISGILAATLIAPLVYIQVMQLGRRRTSD